MVNWKNGVWKIVTKSQVVTKFNVTKSRLHCTWRRRWSCWHCSVCSFTRTLCSLRRVLFSAALAWHFSMLSNIWKIRIISQFEDKWASMAIPTPLSVKVVILLKRVMWPAKFEYSSLIGQGSNHRSLMLVTWHVRSALCTSKEISVHKLLHKIYIKVFSKKCLHLL